MANVNRPNGLTLVGTISGAPFNGNIREYQMTGSTAIFIGDLIKRDDTTGLVAPAAAGDEVIGVCVGLRVDRAIAATESPGYAPASSGAYIQVAVGPDYIYEIQEDSVGNNIAIANIGSNGDVVAGAGNTTTGTSGYLLDSSDVAAKDSIAASAQLRLIDFVNREGNEVGTYGRWLVVINEHALKNLTGI